MVLAAVLLQDRLNEVSSGSRDVISVMPKILGNFLTILSMSSDALDLQAVTLSLANHGWLTFLLRPLKFGASAGSVVEDPTRVSFSMSCFLQHIHGDFSTPGVYLEVVLAWLIIPVALLALLLFSLLTAALFTSVRRRRMVWQRRLRRLVRRSWHIFRPKAIVLAYILHPSVSKMFLSTFRCLQADPGLHGTPYGDPRWHADFSIVCTDRRHKSWMIVAGIGLLVWSIGIPIFFFVSLRRVLMKGKHSLASPVVRRTYGFLYTGFEPSLYGYESVFMIKKGRLSSLCHTGVHHATCPNRALALCTAHVLCGTAPL
jgi:hypothetical protein